MPYLYDVAYVNGFEEYSNLKFKELDINVGMNYDLSKNLGLGLHYYYNKLDDEEEYVYGDQSITLNSLLGYVTFRY